MAGSIFTGPLASLGALAGPIGGGQPREYSDEIGPSIFFNGFVFPTHGVSKDRTGQGAIGGVYASMPIRTINAAPAAGNVALTTAANAVAGTALPNSVTYAAGKAAGCPAVVNGVSVTNAIGLDMALDLALMSTAGTATLNVIANAWRYRVGQWVALLNGGPSGSVLMSQITAINATTGVLSVSPAPSGNAGGGIALTNRFNPNTYGASQTPPTSISSMAPAGLARISIPEVGTARGVGVTGVAGGTGGQFLITGITNFGQVQTELVTVGAGAVTGWSKKTFDIFVSAVPQFSDAHNYTVVSSDLLGLPLAVMSADSIISVTLAGTAEVAGTNFTVALADTTYPATQTTADPRGGIQVTANGPYTAPGTPMVLNGTSVLQIDQRISALQAAAATVINNGPVTGVPVA